MKGEKMYKYELKIIEITKDKEEIEILNTKGRGIRTLKNACKEIRKELLPYVSKNEK